MPPPRWRRPRYRWLHPELEAGVGTLLLAVLVTALMLWVGSCAPTSPTSRTLL